MTDESAVSTARLPHNVRAGAGTVITGGAPFHRLNSLRDPAVVIGANCTMDRVHFALGPEGVVEIGDYCCFTSAILLCEQNIRIGNYVVIGWNTTIADTDFHPLEPAQRIADAIASSPLGTNRPRPHIEKLPVIIEDDVWIGPNTAILKGVVIGAGAFIEPGSLVAHDVPPRTRVIGNPARVVGTV